jgi:hypothetical protein
MVGDDCAAQRHNLEVSYPVTNGALRRRTLRLGGRAAGRERMF